jgi:hypothetical protein
MYRSRAALFVIVRANPACRRDDHIGHPAAEKWSSLCLPSADARLILVDPQMEGAMSAATTPFLLTETGCVGWRATSLRELGRNESFLEKVIGANPSLLGLEDRRTHVAGPYVPFHQLHLDTPQGRSVKSDVVFLTQSGHVVVVEVKLADNPELAQRHVVAQVLDYASSLAGYSEDEVVAVFGGTGDESFAAVTRRLFPGAIESEELADVLLDRMRNAELHLVIACDRAPDGLREFVRGVSNQSALGSYELRVVEIVPYVTGEQGHGVLLVPSCLARTEIVSRAAVNITITEGQPNPGVEVVVSSPDDVEESVRQARAPREMRPELAAAVAEWDSLADPTLRSRGVSPSFRQIKVPGWPLGVHYEFLSYANGVGAELHLESDKVRPLSAVLEGLVASLRSRFPNVVWDPAWASHRGRVLVRPAGGDGRSVAESMRDLVAGTREAIQTALDRVPS